MYTYILVWHCLHLCRTPRKTRSWRGSSCYIYFYLRICVGYNFHLGPGMHWRRSGNSSIAPKQAWKWHWTSLRTKWITWYIWDAFCGVHGLWWLQVCKANNGLHECIHWKFCKSTFVDVHWVVWQLDTVSLSGWHHTCILWKGWKTYDQSFETVQGKCKWHPVVWLCLSAIAFSKMKVLNCSLSYL